MDKTVLYKTALESILQPWADSQDRTDQPIRWAEDMAGIASDALTEGIESNRRCHVCNTAVGKNHSSICSVGNGVFRG